MKRKKTFTMIISIAMLMLLAVSCRWDVWGGQYTDYGEGTGGPSSYFRFAGDAPQYVTATQARFSDRIVVSWNAVRGADYYEVYRAETPSTTALQGNLLWNRMNENPVGTNMFIDTEVEPGKLYVYRVRAMNFAYRSIIGDYSAPSYGWMLTSPNGLSASQGEDTKYIRLSWNTVPNVIGYRVYWSSTGYGGTWNVAIPEGLEAYDYVFPANISEFNFKPDKIYKGASLFFYVESCSASGDVSAPSSQRMGYTLVEGAPQKPANFNAEQGQNTDRIVLSWDKLYGKKDGEDIDYEWEIYRSSEGESEKKIYSTSDGDAKPQLVGDRMVFTDRTNVKPGVKYRYSLRAIGQVKNENDAYISVNGIPAVAEGFLISPPTVIKDVGITEKDGKKGFTFTFEDALLAPSHDSWTYTVYAAETPEGEWVKLPGYEDIPVTDQERKTVFSEYSDSVKYEYFDIKTSDGVKESLGYASPLVAKKPIAVSRPRSAENFAASDNTVFSGMTPEGGFYPVALTMVGEPDIASYRVRIWKEKPDDASSPGYEEKAVSSFLKADSGDVTISGVGATGIGEYGYYAVQGIDSLGREGTWSVVDSGYSAITGDLIIKYMQPYALKPWEYIGKPVLTSEYPYPDKDIDTKWKNSQIWGKVSQAGTGSLTSGITESSYFHGGKIKYAASVLGIGAKITFTYTNFGEVEWMKNTGYFTMEVNASGTGSCSGSFQIDGMYPASIGLGNMNVTNQAFSGTYTVNQANGSAPEEVSPNQRY